MILHCQSILINLKFIITYTFKSFKKHLYKSVNKFKTYFDLKIYIGL